MNPPTHKTCSTCKQHLPATEFHQRRERRDGLQPSCKSCQATHTKQWRQRNRKQHTATSRRSWLKKAHPGVDLHVWDASRKLKALARRVPVETAGQLKAIAGDLLNTDG